MTSSSVPLSIETPWGWLWLGEDVSSDGWTWCPEASGRQTPDSHEEAVLVEAFTAYGEGDETVLMEWPLPQWVGTPFQRAVWEALQDIPNGHTATYGDIAQQMAQKTSSRPAPQAVGQACRRNPWPLRVPCHRVISTAEAQGHRGFVGYAGQTSGFLPDIKTQLLAWERQLLSMATLKTPVPTH